MKEADIDQNGIQTEACLCTNRFKCLLYYFCFGRIVNSTRFCYFFIGVSTPGKNRTQFIDQYNTSANKRISYSSRLFEVTCCRIKIMGLSTSVHRLLVVCPLFCGLFFCCIGMVHPQYFIHYIVCIHSSGISLFFACNNGVRHAIFKIFI